MRQWVEFYSSRVRTHSPWDALSRDKLLAVLEVHVYILHVHVHVHTCMWFSKPSQLPVYMYIRLYASLYSLYMYIYIYSTLQHTAFSFLKAVSSFTISLSFSNASVLYTYFPCTCIYMYISVMCACHVMHTLPVTPAQLMMPGIGRNAYCTLAHFNI